MPPIINKPVLQYGSNGADVVELQSLLNQRLGAANIIGLALPLITDGDFGRRTERAAIAYQNYVCLVGDGIVGTQTWASLYRIGLPDIKNHWAADFITQLYNAAIVQGDDLGNFNPDTKITRAQVAALLVKSFDPLPVVRPANPFSDVPATYWGAIAIQQAYQAGFMSGYDDGTFKPNLSMLRQDVLVVLAKTLTSPTGTVNLNAVYSDAAAISPYARAGVTAATLLGLVVNYPTLAQLRPLQEATRAEVAAMLSRARSVAFKQGRTLNYRPAQYSITSSYVVSIN